MTNQAAIDLVLRMAEAHANGHEHCLEILRAIARVRELLNVAKRGKTEHAREKEHTI